MSLVENALNEFLKSSEAGVFALIGDWGVGKTHIWNQIIEEKKDSLTRPKYSYVSLFGLTSIIDVKREIFLNAVDKKKIGQNPDLDTLSGNFTPKLKKLGGVLQSVPLLKRMLPSEESLMFFALKDLVICLDDLERAGKGLDVKDVLGLASSLKEQKNAKVVILLNRAQQINDDYEKYKEKVVDFEFEYKPRPDQIFDIVFDNSFQFYAYAKQKSESLGIRNIRVLKRCKSLIDSIFTDLSVYSDALVEDVISSLILYSHCNFSHHADNSIPSCTFISEYKASDVLSLYYKMDGEASTSPEQLQRKKWIKYFEAYGYGETDEKDSVLLEGVVCGFIDKEKLHPLLASRDLEFRQTALAGDIKKAWEIFRGSFDDNADAFISALYESSKSNIKHIGFADLNSAVKRLRQLDRSDYADEIIGLFVESRATENDTSQIEEAFDSVSDEIDPKIRDIWSQQLKRKASVNFTDAAVRLLNGQYAEEHIVAVVNGSVSDYVDFLKASHGGYRMVDKVRTLEKYKHYSGSNKQYSRIFDKLVDALKLIAEESKINKMRVDSFNILPKVL